MMMHILFRRRFRKKKIKIVDNSEGKGNEREIKKEKMQWRDRVVLCFT